MRYYTFSNYVKNKFGVKVGKISIDTDFGCMHKGNDGGCRFCNLESYRPPYIIESDIENQWESGVSNYRNRYSKYYGYFQLGTPLSPMASDSSLIYANKIIKFDNCVGLMFGARSDMLEENVISELNSLAEEYNKEIWFEMGLQSSNEETSEFINRGHNFESFANMVQHIKQNYKNIIICTHIIFGLPKKIENNNIILETEDEMLQTVKDVSNLNVHSIKFHQLDIVKKSAFEYMYYKYNFPTIDENFYIDLIVESIRYIKKDIIISRLVGDSLYDSLIAPKWNKSKGEIINLINKKLEKNNIIQGDMNLN